MKRPKKRKKNSAVTAINGVVYSNQGEIAYQNKDITSKLLAEYFKGKTFRVYGLNVPEVKAVLPTNAQIEDKSQQIFALAGILTFTDKLIDMKTANKIRRMISMTKIGWIIEQEKQEALAKAEKQKQQELAEAEEEKRQALAKAEEEKQQAVAEQKQQAARESVIKMIRKNYPTEEIAFIVSSFSQDDIEAVRRELAETE